MNESPRSTTRRAPAGFSRDALAVAIALAVDGPALAAVGVHRRVAERPRRVQAEQADRGFGRDEGEDEAEDEEQDLPTAGRGGHGSE